MPPVPPRFLRLCCTNSYYSICSLSRKFLRLHYAISRLPRLHVTYLLPDTSLHCFSLQYNLFPEHGEDKGRGKLHRDIGLVLGVALVIGNIIGSGIFITPTEVLSFSGSFGLYLILWVIGAIITLFGALSYAELSTMITKAGSEYSYILEGFSFKRRRPWLELLGSTLAFLFTWISMIMLQGAGMGIVTLTFGRYISQPFFIGCEIPSGVDRLLALTALCEPM